MATVKDYAPGTTSFARVRRPPGFISWSRGASTLELCTAGEGCTRLQTVGPGELLGWSPVLGLSEMTATARVIEPTTLVVVDAKQLVTLCEHNPRFGYEFMRRTALALSQRLSATRLQLLDVFRHELPLIPEQGEA